MKRGIRLTAKKLKNDDVTQACADALTRTFGDLATRATGLRAELASGS
jgi:hypothetical protein